MFGHGIVRTISYLDNISKYSKFNTNFYGVELGEHVNHAECHKSRKLLPNGCIYVYSKHQYESKCCTFRWYLRTFLSIGHHGPLVQ